MFGPLAAGEILDLAQIEGAKLFVVVHEPQGYFEGCGAVEQEIGE